MVRGYGERNMVNRKEHKEHKNNIISGMVQSSAVHGSTVIAITSDFTNREL
jgi:hypothetical protein